MAPVNLQQLKIQIKKVQSIRKYYFKKVNAIARNNTSRRSINSFRKSNQRWKNFREDSVENETNSILTGTIADKITTTKSFEFCRDSLRSECICYKCLLKDYDGKMMDVNL